MGFPQNHAPTPKLYSGHTQNVTVEVHPPNTAALQYTQYAHYRFPKNSTRILRLQSRQFTIGLPPCPPPQLTGQNRTPTRLSKNATKPLLCSSGCFALVLPFLVSAFCFLLLLLPYGPARPAQQNGAEPSPLLACPPPTAPATAP